MTVAAIIVAAGRGRRLGGSTPKQYIPINGVPAIRRSLDAFLAHQAIDWILPIIHPDDQALFQSSLEGLNNGRVLHPAFGGETRAQSVLNGLIALSGRAPDLVLIHDAARAFVPVSLIERVLVGLETADGACAALPVVDALWREADGFAEESVSREGLWRAQTPQGFQFAAILSAHKAHDGTGADDVFVAREAGLTVQFVQGSEMNYKITTQDDLSRALRDARESSA